MSQRFVLKVSLAISTLLSPSLLVAQRGAPAVAGHAQMAASTHGGSVPAAQAVHAPAHGASGGSHIVSAHLAPVGTRSSGPRPAAHPAGYQTLAHTYSAHPRPSYLTTYPSNNEYPAPGLGFDYVHYFAVHPNSGQNHSHFRGGAIFPILGGVYYPAADYVEPGSADEQSADLIQNGPNDQPVDGGEADAQLEEVPASSLRSKAAPAPPSSEYIFVRRDGSVFFAVAYSWVNGNLQYVTNDGFRKLVSTGTLDLDATTQFNEQRGVPFHSPA